MAQNIEKLVEKKVSEYNEKLKDFRQESIQAALQFLMECKETIHNDEQNGINKNFSLSIDTLDDETKEIFSLMEQMKKDIKQIYIENKGVLTHITTVAPEKLESGKIRKSNNRANNYGTEKGDWVFASSEPIDGRNAYIARQEGMILIGKDIYIYGGDIIENVADEYGDKHAVLRSPNYIYEINPENFTPVMTLQKNMDGKTFFQFSHEWTSETDIDITDQNQVSGVRTITDVTDVVKHYQVLCDTKKYEKDEKLIGIIIKEQQSIEEAQEILREHLQSGELRYINGECGINQDETITNLAQTSLNMDMHLDEFNARKREILSKQNVLLRDVDPVQMQAYHKLIEYKATKNYILLNGSFRKDLGVKKDSSETANQRKKYEEKIEEILQEVRELFGTDIIEENIEGVLNRESQDVEMILQETRQQLKQAANETNLILNSCIYIAPRNLQDGKLQPSKDVLNIAGELGAWIFASSSRIVDNPYLLRKAGKGVIGSGNLCIPGDIDLVSEKNGRAILSTPAYIYLMKPDEFEPVVTADFLDTGDPVIRFEDEWTADKDIEKENFRVKKVIDITEMLDYLQLFSPVDRETYMMIANASDTERAQIIKELILQGKLNYINEECGINEDSRFSSRPKMSISKETTEILAKQLDVQLEKQESDEAINSLTNDKIR